MSDINAGTTEAIVGVQFAHDVQASEQSKPSPKAHPKSWKWGSNVKAGYDSSATNNNNFRH